MTYLKILTTELNHYCYRGTVLYWKQPTAIDCRVLLYKELSVESHPLLPGVLRHVTVHLIPHQPLKGPEPRCHQDSPSHTFSLDYRPYISFS